MSNEIFSASAQETTKPCSFIIGDFVRAVAKGFIVSSPDSGISNYGELVGASTLPAYIALPEKKYAEWNEKDRREEAARNLSRLPFNLNQIYKTSGSAITAEKSAAQKEMIKNFDLYIRVAALTTTLAAHTANGETTYPSARDVAEIANNVVRSVLANALPYPPAQTRGKKNAKNFIV